MASSSAAIGVAAAILLTTSVSAAQSARPVLAPEATSEGPAVFPPSQYRSPKMMVSGIVVGTIGVLSLAAGGFGLTAGCSHATCSEGGGFVFPAIALLAAGAVHVLVGVPILIAGALPPRAATAPTSASWAVPTLAGGPGSTVLRWTF